ncbi:MAG: hypothetical protein JSR54_15300 [Proteobacteria bacterium]|nr:hypothetical protein [Pseudomonadota bacterium]
MTFTVEAYPDRPFAGTVVQVRQAPQTVQNVVTYDAVVGVSNRDLKLMPGMTAAVRIITAERAGVLRVPDQALRYTPAGLGRAARDSHPPPAPADGVAAGGRRSGTLWKLEGGRPVRVPVELGLDDDSYTEVLGGAVSADDLVVIGESATTTASAAPRMPRM